MSTGHESEGSIIPILSGGALLLLLAGVAGGGIFLAVEKRDPVFDCSQSRMGVVDLTLNADEQMSLKAINGNDKISFKEARNGGITIFVDEGTNQENKVPMTLSSGETVTGSEVDLKPGQTASFKDNDMTVEISGSPASNGKVNVELTGTCKLSK